MIFLRKYIFKKLHLLLKHNILASLTQVGALPAGGVSVASMELMLFYFLTWVIVTWLCFVLNHTLWHLSFCTFLYVCYISQIKKKCLKPMKKGRPRHLHWRAPQKFTSCSAESKRQFVPSREAAYTGVDQSCHGSNAAGRGLWGPIWGGGRGHGPQHPPRKRVGPRGQGSALAIPAWTVATSKF